VDGEPMQRNNNSISSRVSLGDNKVLLEPVNKDRLGSMGLQCFDEDTKSVIGCVEGILPLATQSDSTMLPATRSITLREKRIRKFEHLKMDESSGKAVSKLEDYKYLKRTTHRDDEDMLLYRITRVYEFKKTGDIIGDSALIFKDGSLFENFKADPIHIHDLVIITKRYEKEKQSNITCNLITALSGCLAKI